MSDANKFLFIGGCADGQRLAVPPGQHTVVVPRPFKPKPYPGIPLEAETAAVDHYEHQYVVFPHVSVFGLRGMDAKRLAKILVDKYPQHEDKDTPPEACSRPMDDRANHPQPQA